MIAAEYENIEIVRLLIAHKADVNAMAITVYHYFFK